MLQRIGHIYELRRRIGHIYGGRGKMAVRVKLRIRTRNSGRDVETIALVNSGFETTTPPIACPTEASRGAPIASHRLPRDRL